MNLFIFRHGIAEDREKFLKKGLDEALRPLTEKGREKTEQVAKALVDSFEGVSLIVSSPLVRAHQTALIISSVLKKAKIIECAELVPSAPPEAFCRWLKTHAGVHTRLIVVGHEPHLSTFASYCLSGQHVSFIDLKKSGVIHLEVESFLDIGPRSATMKWMLQPKLV